MEPKLTKEIHECEKTTVKKVLIFAGGEKSSFTENLQKEECMVICADSGLELCQEFGLTPDMLVGDMDSIEQELLEKAQELYPKMSIEVHPGDKDETDLELALKHIDESVSEVTMYGALGGRLDHTLFNIDLSVNCFKRLKKLKKMRLVGASDDVYVLACRIKHLFLEGEEGDIVSLLPYEEKVTKVSIIGVKFPLFEHDLIKGETLSVSNEMSGTKCEISLDTGTLLVIHRHL